LGKAKERLGKYYSFMQVSVHQPEKAPVMMKKGGYSNNGGGVGVLAMLSKIISDTETTSKEATKDEQDAVTAYQSFVAKTNKSQDERKRAVVANNMKAAANKEAQRCKRYGYRVQHYVPPKTWSIQGGFEEKMYLPGEEL